MQPYGRSNPLEITIKLYHRRIHFSLKKKIDGSSTARDISLSKNRKHRNDRSTERDTCRRERR